MKMKKNIAIFINTPAQFYFYNKISEELRRRGHGVYMLVRDHPDNLKILDELNLDVHIFSKPRLSKWAKLLIAPLDVINTYRYLSDKEIDVVTGFGNVSVYTSKLLGVPSIVFTDTEFYISSLLYEIQYKLVLIFTDMIVTPSSFNQDFDERHIKVNSYKEMAYLHPRYFKPKKDIYEYLNIPEDEDYIVVRFNAFGAIHDEGVFGFDRKEKMELIKKLSDIENVFVSCEGEVPEGVKPFLLKAPRNRIHDVLYYSKLFVTDTQTMATEAALLGVPTVRCNSFVGAKDMGNFVELEETYGLIFNYQDSKRAIERSLELARSEDIKKVWRNRLDALMKDKTDITRYMADILETYPHISEDLQKGLQKESDERWGS